MRSAADSEARRTSGPNKARLAEEENWTKLDYFDAEVRIGNIPLFYCLSLSLCTCAIFTLLTAAALFFTLPPLPHYRSSLSAVDLEHAQTRESGLIYDRMFASYVDDLDCATTVSDYLGLVSSNNSLRNVKTEQHS